MEDIVKTEAMYIYKKSNNMKEKQRRKFYEKENPRSSRKP